MKRGPGVPYTTRPDLLQKLFGDRKVHFIPVRLTDELGEGTTIISRGPQPITNLAILGTEGDLLYLCIVNHDFLLELEVVKFDRHNILFFR